MQLSAKTFATVPYPCGYVTISGKDLAYFPLTVHVDTRHAACRRKSMGVLPYSYFLFKPGRGEFVVMLLHRKKPLKVFMCNRSGQMRSNRR